MTTTENKRPEPAPAKEPDEPRLIDDRSAAAIATAFNGIMVQWGYLEDRRNYLTDQDARLGIMIAAMYRQVTPITVAQKTSEQMEDERREHEERRFNEPPTPLHTARSTLPQSHDTEVVRSIENALGLHPQDLDALVEIQRKAAANG